MSAHMHQEHGASRANLAHGEVLSRMNPFLVSLVPDARSLHVVKVPCGNAVDWG